MAVPRHLVALVTTLGLSVAACPLTPFPVPTDDVVCSQGQCEDGNPCTADTCDPETGGCSFAPLAINTDCDDGNVCNGIARCDGTGQCRAGDPVELLDDGDACTDTVCDPVTGDLSHPPVDGCTANSGWFPLGVDGAPKPRFHHSAVWTGDRMIVWGGRINGSPSVTSTGSIYDPADDTWTPTNTDGAPNARWGHSAVWTGDRMLVWGGFGTDASGASGYATDGALYDPVSDDWTPISGAEGPSGRTSHSTVWTGDTMIVWGGLNGPTALNSGAVYDPEDDTWTTTAVGLSARFNHTAVWDGARMVTWGGTDTFDWLGNGAYYDPSRDTWSTIEDSDAPSFRESSTGVWTGSAMLIWGGWNGGPYLNDGGLLDPDSGAQGTWTPLTADSPPVVRARHVSVWTGQGLFVWSGCTGGELCGEVIDDGGRWSEGDGSWTGVPADPALEGRYGHTIVWTGSEVIVWGGRAVENTIYGNGARAVPSSFDDLL